MGACQYCGGQKREGDICCDDCWKRIPTHLPAHNRWRGGAWRSELKHCRRMGGYSWNIAADIIDTVKAWLQAHRLDQVAN